MDNLFINYLKTNVMSYNDLKNVKEPEWMKEGYKSEFDYLVAVYLRRQFEDWEIGTNDKNPAEVGRYMEITIVNLLKI